MESVNIEFVGLVVIDLQTLVISYAVLKLVYIWAVTQKKLSSGVCEQHRPRPACASSQSDQRLSYLLFGKYHM